MPREANFLNHIKPTVTIPRPMPSVFSRGVTSPNRKAPTFSIRIHNDVLETIDAAAETVNMTRSEFIKWCSFHVARNVLDQKALFDRRMR